MDSGAARHQPQPQSPDVPFEQSINPYRGCEHGCIYCYARPSHAYLGLSPGHDFESKLFAKQNAAEVLKAELGRKTYRPSVIALGANTDPYQPVERRLEVTRSILEVLAAHRHPVGIVTKSALVQRDIDVLSAMARDGLVRVHVSITTLDRRLARAMEPRASTPPRRLEAVRALADAGIPVGVMVAPILPALTDHEIETILAAAGGRRGRKCGLYPAAPAARGRPAVRGMADGNLPRSRRAGVVTDPPVTRRKDL